MNRIFIYPLFALTALLLSNSPARAEATSPLDEARAAVKSRDLPKAAALLEPLTGAEAKDPAALHLLSQVRLMQRNAPEAVALAERAVALDATNAAYFVQLG